MGVEPPKSGLTNQQIPGWVSLKVGLEYQQVVPGLGGSLKIAGVFQPKLLKRQVQVKTWTTRYSATEHRRSCVLMVSQLVLQDYSTCYPSGTRLGRLRHQGKPVRVDPALAGASLSLGEPWYIYH